MSKWPKIVDMNDKSFLRLLRRSLNESPARLLHLEGLSGEELSIAKRINDEIDKAGKYEVIASGSIRIMERAEHFDEKIIGVLSAMIKVSVLSTTEKELDSLCRSIVRIFSKELDFDNCSIMLKDEKEKYMVLIAGSGKGDKYKREKTWKTGTIIEITDGIAGKAFSTGKPVFIPDVARDVSFKIMDTDVRIASILSVPIKAGQEVIGVINFSHPIHHEVFDRNLENLMMLLSSFVGQVITLAKLYNSMSHWNEALKEEVDKKTAELTRKNRQLRKIALIDPLTGIYSRRFFFKRLEEEFLRMTRYGVQFSLLFIDIDNLKPINDTYGHIVGDRVIKALSQNLRQIGRKGDVACRLGGDEFGYMLLESDIEGACNFALRLKEKFAKHNFKGLKYAPTVSIGIANTHNVKFRDHKDIYNAADKALYDAKAIKNSVCVFSQKRPHRKVQLPPAD